MEGLRISCAITRLPDPAPSRPASAAPTSYATALSRPNSAQPFLSRPASAASAPESPAPQGRVAFVLASDVEAAEVHESEVVAALRGVGFRVVRLPLPADRLFEAVLSRWRGDEAVVLLWILQKAGMVDPLQLRAVEKGLQERGGLHVVWVVEEVGGEGTALRSPFPCLIRPRGVPTGNTEGEGSVIAVWHGGDTTLLTPLLASSLQQPLGGPMSPFPLHAHRVATALPTAQWGWVVRPGDPRDPGTCLTSSFPLIPAPPQPLSPRVLRLRSRHMFTPSFQRFSPRSRTKQELSSADAVLPPPLAAFWREHFGRRGRVSWAALHAAASDPSIPLHPPPPFAIKGVVTPSELALSAPSAETVGEAVRGGCAVPFVNHIRDQPPDPQPTRLSSIDVIPPPADTETVVADHHDVSVALWEAACLLTTAMASSTQSEALQRLFPALRLKLKRTEAASHPDITKLSALAIAPLPALLGRRYKTAEEAAWGVWQLPVAEEPALVVAALRRARLDFDNHGIFGGMPLETVSVKKEVLKILEANHPRGRRGRPSPKKLGIPPDVDEGLFCYKVPVWEGEKGFLSRFARQWLAWKRHAAHQHLPLLWHGEGKYRSPRSLAYHVDILGGVCCGKVSLTFPPAVILPPRPWRACDEPPRSTATSRAEAVPLALAGAVAAIRGQWYAPLAVRPEEWGTLLRHFARDRRTDVPAVEPKALHSRLHKYIHEDKAGTVVTGSLLLTLPLSGTVTDISVTSAGYTWCTTSTIRPPPSAHAARDQHPFEPTPQHLLHSASHSALPDLARYQMFSEGVCAVPVTGSVCTTGEDIVVEVDWVEVLPWSSSNMAFGPLHLPTTLLLGPLELEGTKVVSTHLHSALKVEVVLRGLPTCLVHSSSHRLVSRCDEEGELVESRFALDPDTTWSNDDVSLWVVNPVRSSPSIVALAEQDPETESWRDNWGGHLQISLSPPQPAGVGTFSSSASILGGLACAFQHQVVVLLDMGEHVEDAFVSAMCKGTAELFGRFGSQDRLGLLLFDSAVVTKDIPSVPSGMLSHSEALGAVVELENDLPVDPPRFGIHSAMAVAASWLAGDSHEVPDAIQSIVIVLAGTCPDDEVAVVRHICENMGWARAGSVRVHPLTVGRAANAAFAGFLAISRRGMLPHSPACTPKEVFQALDRVGASVASTWGIATALSYEGPVGKTVNGAKGTAPVGVIDWVSPPVIPDLTLWCPLRVVGHYRAVPPDVVVVQATLADGRLFREEVPVGLVQGVRLVRSPEVAMATEALLWAAMQSRGNLLEVTVPSSGTLVRFAGHPPPSVEDVKAALAPFAVVRRSHISVLQLLLVGEGAAQVRVEFAMESTERHFRDLLAEKGRLQVGPWEVTLVSVLPRGTWDLRERRSKLMGMVGLPVLTRGKLMIEAAKHDHQRTVADQAIFYPQYPLPHGSSWGTATRLPVGRPTLIGSMRSKGGFFPTFTSPPC